MTDRVPAHIRFEIVELQAQGHELIRQLAVWKQRAVEVNRWWAESPTTDDPSTPGDLDEDLYYEGGAGELSRLAAVMEVVLGGSPVDSYLSPRQRELLEFIEAKGQP